MELQMELSQCSVSSMIQLDMLIKGVEKGKDPLLFILVCVCSSFCCFFDCDGWDCLISLSIPTKTSKSSHFPILFFFFFLFFSEPWHADIFQFLDLKKNHGNEMERARDLFYALWISDLFMKRVEEGY